jgi:transcriptional regulator with PAS, ATPase and Fis domain
MPLSKTAKRILASKSIGWVRFDGDFRMDKCDRRAKHLIQTISNVNTGSKGEMNTDLRDCFPEFIGQEYLIRAVLAREKDNLCIKNVNRLDNNENRYYLNFCILPCEVDGKGLLLLEDVTTDAKIRQELLQQRNDLLLLRQQSFYKGVSEDKILGDSPAIKEIREIIGHLNRVPRATVLLLGESGTGKNLAARTLHYGAMPPDAPFVEINCAALPDNLIESELFGYEKGAFTHAVASRDGLFKEAENGTIFLNEIGELSLPLQAKLLSVLEDKCYRRLGSNKLIHVDTRIMAATNRELSWEVTQNRFRNDLYYRLNVVSIQMPPLRRMGKDVLIIADHFIRVFNGELKKHVQGLTSSAKKVLLAYSWPGNVRELSNCIERAMIFCNRPRIDAKDLVMTPTETDVTQSDWVVPTEGLKLKEVERKLIISAMNRCGNNKAKAARLLGLTRDTLRYRLEKYRID